MPDTNAPAGNCPDADPSMMTRQQALTDALKARRTPQQDRAYSTLVRSSDVDQDDQPEAIDRTPLTFESPAARRERILRLQSEADAAAARYRAEATETGYERLLGAVEAYNVSGPDPRLVAGYDQPHECCAGQGGYHTTVCARVIEHPADCAFCDAIRQHRGMGQ